MRPCDVCKQEISMKKRIAIISAVLVVVLALSLVFVACNKYKWDSIGGGDASAEVESNGGYAVKQGKYLYYINGFDGTDADNTFGVPVTQAIMRTEVTENADGSWTLTEENKKTSKIVVPKTVLYSSSVKDGGIAVFGEWIYYATPNYDKDKNGNPSTTDVDFMRTRTDGAITQKIATISGRDTRYLFTPNRIIYLSGSSVNYIDFSGMKTNKSINNGKGAQSGTLVETTTGTVLWKMGCDRIFYVQPPTGSDSYKHYNEICSIKLDGSDQKTLATQKDASNEDVLNTFEYTLLAMLPEGDDVTLYYSKTHRNGESDASDGFFCAKASDVDGTEYLMSTQSVTSSANVYPLGYEEGVLLNISSNLYIVKRDDTSKLKDRLIVSGTPTVCYTDKTAKKIYYTSSSVTGLACISYDIEKPDNQALIFNEGVKTDWLELDFIGTNLFFFATDDSNSMHVIDVKNPIYGKKDDDGEALKTDYVGFYRETEEEDEQ